MSNAEERAVADEIAASLDRLSADEAVGSNCMFQLALMVARIAVEPCPESYRAEAAAALMGLIRAKPKGNVVRLFDGRARARDPSGLRAAAG